MNSVCPEYPIFIRDKEVVLDCGYRADLLVDESIGFLNIFFAVFAVFVVYFCILNRKDRKDREEKYVGSFSCRAVG
jgi:hypothetical protein